ncbi:MAG: hypothetical protein R3F19_32415 [Verrucomicrobiales bacterium]
MHKAAMAVKERLFDLSAFVKELKFKFSVWFNKWHGQRDALGRTVSQCVAGGWGGGAVLCGVKSI